MSQSQPQPPEADRPLTEDTPPPAIPSSVQPAAVQPAAAQPNKLTVFFRLVGQLWGIVVAVIPLVFSLLRQLVKLALQGLKSIQSLWAMILPNLRTRLPEPWKTKLPDQLLTAIALLLLLLTISATSSLLSKQSPAIAEAPGQPRSALPAEKPAINPDKLAKIQDRVAEIADPYAEGLVKSVQVNAPHSRLKITVGNAWYALEPAQQDKLANDVLKRSHKLKFDRLELTDVEGIPVARSPVVGSTMLILERVPTDADAEPI